MTFLIKFLLAVTASIIFGLLYRFFKRPKSIEAKTFLKPKYLECSFGRVHYVQTGKGPDVVLIHGIGASHIVWKRLILRLKDQYRLTAIDLPGFGNSDKNPKLDYGLDAQCDRVVEVLKKLNIKKTHLVGNSMGGGISLWLAKKHPELVESIVAINPAANHKMVPINTNFLWPLVHLLKYRFPTPSLVNYLHDRALSEPDQVLPSEKLAYYTPYHRNPDAVVCFWKAHDTLRDPRLPQELENLQVKTLILYGEQDRLVASRYIQDLMHVLQDATLVTSPDGGHHLMVDRPDFVSSEICKFIGTTL